MRIYLLDHVIITDDDLRRTENFSCIIRNLYICSVKLNIKVMKIRSFFFYFLCLLSMASCGGSSDDGDDYTPKSGYEIVNGKRFVDLGLPSHTLWAETNVGANKIEDFGDYYAWGECETKDYYWEDNNYKWNKVKYPSDNLSSSDDVATSKWGDGVRMPTRAEAKELVENCTFTWTTYKGVKGYSVKGKNNNFIFLPAGGLKNKGDRRGYGLMCEYWTSTQGNFTMGYHISLDSSYMGTEDEIHVASGNKYNGLLVRPVTVK